MHTIKHKNQKKVSSLEDHLGYWLRFVSNHVSQSFQRKLGLTGISVGEWVILSELYQNGSVLPSVLAESIGMTRGGISRLVDRIEAKGLIERKISFVDRRSHSIGLTKHGQKIVPELAALADQNEEDFFAHMPLEQRAQIIAMMKEVVRVNNIKTIPTD